MGGGGQEPGDLKMQVCGQWHVACTSREKTASGSSPSGVCITPGAAPRRSLPATAHHKVTSCYLDDDTFSKTTNLDDADTKINLLDA